MKRLVFLIVMMISLNTFAQSKYETSKDPENGSIVLKGAIAFDDLLKEQSFSWFKQNADYKPEDASVQYLKAHLPAYKIVVVMGTWCEDSQNLVPKLYTLLQAVGYPVTRLSIYGVDRSKDALNGEKITYSIERVPTIILFKEGKEIGRIVESVSKSIEADLTAIITKDK